MPIISALPNAVAAVPPLAAPSAASGEAFASLLFGGSGDDGLAAGGKDVPEGIGAKAEATPPGADQVLEMRPGKAPAQPRAVRCRPPVSSLPAVDALPATGDPALPPADAPPTSATDRTPCDLGAPLPAPLVPLAVTLPLVETPADDVAPTASVIASPAPAVDLTPGLPAAAPVVRADGLVVSSSPPEVQPALAGMRVDSPATPPTGPALARPAPDALAVAAPGERQSGSPAGLAQAVAAQTLQVAPAANVPAIVPNERQFDRRSDLTGRIPQQTIPAEPAAEPQLLDTAALLAQRVLGQRGLGQARARPGQAPLDPMATTMSAPTSAATPLAPAIATPSVGPAAMNAPALAALPVPTATIDQIERLRDAADAVSTSIRLIPDALGAIDVSLRKEGELTHVHLAADQPATRALLADAQPRLAEIADERGVRLGRTQVETGGGGGQPAPQQHAPRQPTVLARARAASRGARVDTHRIA